MYNLLPQSLGINLLGELGIVAVNRELLHVRLVLNGTAHKLVVNLHRYVGSSHLALGHLGIDECLGIGMLDAH